jgi:hypothetical protein
VLAALIVRAFGVIAMLLLPMVILKNAGGGPVPVGLRRRPSAKASENAAFFRASSRPNDFLALWPFQRVSAQHPLCVFL